jgi:hypothetical protein
VLGLGQTMIYLSAHVVPSRAGGGATDRVQFSSRPLGWRNRTYDRTCRIVVRPQRLTPHDDLIVSEVVQDLRPR